MGYKEGMRVKVLPNFIHYSHFKSEWFLDKPIYFEEYNFNNIVSIITANNLKRFISLDEIEPYIKGVDPSLIYFLKPKE